jgi:hypothetical protein
VIVPREYNPETKIDFKDVDVWFDNKYKLAEALAELAKTGIEMRFVDVDPKDDLYIFKRKEYDLVMAGKIVARFDFVIIRKLAFPANDFDVNCLVYRFGKNPKVISKCYDQKTQQFVDVKVLKERIMAKEARLLPEYCTLLTTTDDERGPTYQRHINRVLFRYIKTGWNIMYGSKVYDSDCPTRMLLLNWIRTNMEEEAM